MGTIEVKERADGSGFRPGETVFLKSDVKLEPLLAGWPAWTQLISPLSHALNIAFRQLPILRSFLADPELHAAAVSDPAMYGGPFIELGPEAAGEVRSFLERMNRECAPLLEMANDYVEFDRWLQSNAVGHSLDEHYGRLPPSLRGLVELSYDRHSRPSVRLLEGLAYRQRLNDPLQQLYIGRFEDDARPFFLSNPRVRCGEGVIRRIDFCDPRIDALAAARVDGAPFEEIAEILAPTPDDKVSAAEFLATDARRRRRSSSPPHGSVRLSYFGHACVLVQSAETSVLIDPVIPWESASDGRLTFHDLPERIDCIAVTHAHHDHFAPETLLQIRRNTDAVVVPESVPGSVLDPSLKLALRQLGFPNVIALSPTELARFGQAQITALPFPGEHADLEIASKQGVLVELSGKRVAFLADSNAIDIDLYRRLTDCCGGVDALFLGMECHGAPLSWLYGPLLSQPMARRIDESRRLSASDSERALAVVDVLKPRSVFLYAMGREPFVRHLTGLDYGEDCVQLREAKRFLGLCRESGLSAEWLTAGQQLVF